MSIVQPTQEPLNGAQVLVKAMREICNPASGQKGPRSLDINTLKYGLHHAVYDLGAKTLLGSGSFDQAVRTGSRYLLSDPANPPRAAVEISTLAASPIPPCAAVEISTDATGANAIAFRSLNQGPFVAGTAAALAVAQGQPDNTSWTFSVLRIAALKLWLLRVTPKDAPTDASGAERFFAINPAIKSLDSNKVYTASDLVGILTPVIQDLLKQPVPVTGNADLSD
jgi:hypothetical protein